MPKIMYKDMTLSSAADATQSLTQEEYDSLSEAEKKSGRVFYITDGQSKGTVIDSALSETSLNPVQNKVVTNELTQLNSKLDGLHFKVFEFPCPSTTHNSWTNLGKCDIDGNIMSIIATWHNLDAINQLPYHYEEEGNYTLMINKRGNMFQCVNKSHTVGTIKILVLYK